MTFNVTEIWEVAGGILILAIWFCCRLGLSSSECCNNDSGSQYQTVSSRPEAPNRRQTPTISRPVIRSGITSPLLDPVLGSSRARPTTFVNLTDGFDVDQFINRRDQSHIARPHPASARAAGMGGRTYNDDEEKSDIAGPLREPVLGSSRTYAGPNTVVSRSESVQEDPFTSHRQPRYIVRLIPQQPSAPPVNFMDRGAHTGHEEEGVGITRPVINPMPRGYPTDAWPRPSGNMNERLNVNQFINHRGQSYIARAVPQSTLAADMVERTHSYEDPPPSYSECVPTYQPKQ